MKIIEKKYSNNTFENIKHIDDYGNEYWYARELQKVLEYKDWRNFQKVIDKAVLAANNSVSSEEDWVVEINKPIRTGEGKKVRKAIADIGGTMPEEMPTPKKSLKELEREKKQLENKENKKLEGIK